MLFSEWLIAGAAVFLGSLTQGLTGFGYGIIAIPLLTLAVGVKPAICITVLGGMYVSFHAGFPMRKDIHLLELKDLLLGGLVGIPLGAWFLSGADPLLVKRLLAVLILGFVGLNLFRLADLSHLHRNWGYAFGLGAGLSGGAASVSGPLVLIYTSLKNWPKQNFKATLLGYFFVSNILVSTSYLITGLITGQTILEFLKISPFIILGTHLGSTLYHKVDNQTFRKLALALMACMGLLLLWPQRG